VKKKNQESTRIKVRTSVKAGPVQCSTCGIRARLPGKLGLVLPAPVA